MLQFAKAMAEAMRKAIYHCKLEVSTEAGAHSAPNVIEARRQQAPYCDRRLFIHGLFTPQEARFIIRDGGAGFDPLRFPDVRSNLRSLAEGQGRGLVLIRMFMDEVTFNPAGNEITLVRRARREVKGREKTS